jgi:hypothetical protein
MVSALPIKTNPIDRHHLLQCIVEESFKRRIEPEMAQLCKRVGEVHLAEFGSLAVALCTDFDGKLPWVPSFKWLVALYVEEKSYEDAIRVCRVAGKLGLKDGTKGGYKGRVARIQKLAQSGDA